MTEGLESPVPGPVEPMPVLCLGCGYNLALSDPRGVCPECGKPVSHSLIKDSIEEMDPAWALEMAKGIRWLVYYLAASLVLTMVMMFLSMVVNVLKGGVAFPQPGPGGLPTSQPATLPTTLPTSMPASQPAAGLDVIGIVFTSFSSLVGFVVSLAFFYGVERVTRKEGNREGNARPNELWRQAARFCLPVALVLGFLGVVGQIAMSFNPVTRESIEEWTKTGMSWMILPGLVVLAAMLAWMAVWGVLMYSAAVIPADAAKRVGNPSLEKQAKRIVYYLLGAWGCLALMAGCAIVMAGIFAVTKSPIAMIGFCGVCILAPAMSLLGLVMIVETFMCYPKLAKLIEERVKAANPEMG